MAKQSNNLIGVTGEYFVCAELGRRGILALATPKNNPLFDIVAVSPDASKTVLIQVKTMSEGNNQGWKLGVDICVKKNNPLLFSVLMNVTNEKIDYYIYEYDVLAEIVQLSYKKYLEVPKRNGDKRKDIGFRWHDLKQFTNEDKRRKNAWDILGFELSNPIG